MSRKKKTKDATEATAEPVTLNEADEPADTGEIAEEAEIAEKVVYIGPTIRNVITRGRILEGGLPKALEKKIEEIPALRGLIVPISNLSTALQDVKKPKTALNNLYLAVSEKLKK